MTKRTKIALEVFAAIAIVAMVGAYLIRPVFSVSIFNNTTSDVTVWSVAADAPRGTLVHTGIKQWRIPAKSSVTSFFGQFRICPSSGCRLSPYPLGLVVARNASRHTYNLSLPGMGSSHDPCGNLHFCTVNLRLEDDGRIYYAGTGDSRAEKALGQPEGFPVAPDTDHTRAE